MSGTGEFKTEQIEAIASDIDAQNKKLRALLDSSRNSLNSLSGVWTGEAANTTRQSYESFSNRFFQTYEQMLTNYVRYLKESVAIGFVAVEKQSIDLGGNFK